MVKPNGKKSFDKLCNDLNNITFKYNGNAIIYCRVSTKNQTHGYSLDSQEEISKFNFEKLNFNKENGLKI